MEDAENSAHLGLWLCVAVAHFDEELGTAHGSGKWRTQTSVAFRAASDAYTFHNHENSSNQFLNPTGIRNHFHLQKLNANAGFVELGVSATLCRVYLYQLIGLLLAQPKSPHGVETASLAEIFTILEGECVFRSYGVVLCS